MGKIKSLDTFGTMATKPAHVSQETWDRYHPKRKAKSKPVKKSKMSSIYNKNRIYITFYSIRFGVYYPVDGQILWNGSEYRVIKHSVCVDEIMKYGENFPGRPASIERAKAFAKDLDVPMIEPGRYFPRDGIKFMLAILGENRGTYGGAYLRSKP